MWLALAGMLAGCTHAASAPTPARGPQTRAERTGYAETSRYADVMGFIDSLGRLAVERRHDDAKGYDMLRLGGSSGVATWMRVGSIGTSTQGRAIPYVLLSRATDRWTAEARPLVYVQANIHAGEVEGKEALLALVRDLALDPKPNVLDSIVLLAVPIYNADGNERFAPQSINRTEQNGPELVGERANGQGLDLNRDYIKAEAPETRASLAMFAEWNPDVFVDLHTTDGSFHGYALTYSPSLSPAAPAAEYTRATFLEPLRRRMQAQGFPVLDYGNFDSVYEEKDLTDTVKRGWYTYDNRPRFGTNYFGLRNRVAILSEAYSHDPFERRVRATYAFVRGILSTAAENAATLRLRGLAADSAMRATRTANDSTMLVALRSRIGPPHDAPVVSEDLVRTGDSSLTQPGVPRGLRRTGHFRTTTMPVYDRFEPVLRRPLPRYYFVDARDTMALRLLRLHGVTMEHVQRGQPMQSVDAFVVDSIVRSPRPFQGHNEVRLVGHWTTRARDLAASDSYRVDTAQPLGLVAAYLLEPESDDGLTTWNVFDADLTVGGDYPVTSTGARR